VEIIIIHTELSATLKAIKVASKLANGLDASMHLIVPEIVPYPLPLDRPPVPVEFVHQHIRAALRTNGCEARIEILLCRDLEEGILIVLAPLSTVVFCAPTGWTRWSWNNRLARHLRKRGHEVIVTSN
jgi:hypothetical protein